MDRNQRKLARFEAGAQAMGAYGRAALRRAMQAVKEDKQLLNLVTDIAAAVGRSMQRRKSDAQTDARRRKLVGARLPIAQAARCKGCADLLGVSLYRFASDALNRACRLTEAQYGMAWNGRCHQTVIK